MLTIDVVGLPAPQGSKRAFVVNGRAVMAESSKKVKPWRQDVVAAVHNTLAEHPWETPAHAVEVSISFYMPRPGYHFRTGKHSHQLRPNAPAHVDKKPDLDKLARSTLDALTTSAVIKDDAQVARLVIEKRYADGPTGARITITPLDSAVPVTSTPTGTADTTPAPAGALF